MEFMNATHAIGSPPAHTAATKDTLKAALFLATATLTDQTATYSTTNEVTGTNYTAGGITITNGNAPNFTGTTAFWTPSASFVYGTTPSPVTLATAFDAVQIYNSSQGNKTISIHIFGSQTVTAGVFTLTMPVNDNNTGLIRFTKV
jgi:hypothetical protein